MLDFDPKEVETTWGWRHRLRSILYPKDGLELKPMPMPTSRIFEDNTLLDLEEVDAGL